MFGWNVKKEPDMQFVYGLIYTVVGVVLAIVARHYYSKWFQKK